MLTRSSNVPMLFVKMVITIILGLTLAVSIGVALVVQEKDKFTTDEACPFVLNAPQYTIATVIFTLVELCMTIYILRYLSSSMEVSQRDQKSCHAVCLVFLDLYIIIMIVVGHITLHFKFDEFTTYQAATFIAILVLHWLKFIATIFACILNHYWLNKPSEIEAKINSIPRVLYRKTDEESAQQADCVICMEAFECGEYLLQVKCGHEYHEECISTWLHMSEKCPQCRANVYTGEPN